MQPELEPWSNRYRESSGRFPPSTEPAFQIRGHQVCGLSLLILILTMHTVEKLSPPPPLPSPNKI